MTVFVDASAMVAVIANEPEKTAFARKMAAQERLLWSAMSCWETVSALRSAYGWSFADARAEVELIVSQLPFDLAPIGELERAMALDAYQTFGRGSGHPAKLNMGDCFAYACAKINDAQLLYKGNDFSHTDLA